MDPVVIGLLALGTIAVSAIYGAYYYAAQASKLRDVFAASYQLAGHVLLSEEVEEKELSACETLLLDILADPDGPEANLLVTAPAGIAYVDIAKGATRKQCGDAYAGH